MLLQRESFEFVSGWNILLYVSIILCEMQFWENVSEMFMPCVKSEFSWWVRSSKEMQHITSNNTIKIRNGCRGKYFNLFKSSVIYIERIFFSF